MSGLEQKSLALIDHAYQGQVVRLRSKDGYVNATAMCRAVGKHWADYYRLGSTKEFLGELATAMGIPIAELIQSVMGGNPALQGTWVHPDVAINLAQWLSPRFAVQVSRWLREWLISGASPDADAWLIFQERISLVYDSVPAGYFCLFKESADIYASMISAGAMLGARMILDISIGFHWANHWRENGLNARFGDRRTYPHEYPIRYPQSGSNPQQANCYPDAALPEYRRWMREDYLPLKLPEYLKSQVRQHKLEPQAANETLAAIENRTAYRTRVR